MSVLESGFAITILSVFADQQSQSKIPTTVATEILKTAMSAWANYGGGLF